MICIHYRYAILRIPLLPKTINDYRRKYNTYLAKTRLHQSFFRIRVLEAYQSQCAFCSLKYTQLLDAAHIIPDNEDKGEPLVTNGLSLYKIHHAAFDQNMIGVNRL